MGKLQVIKIKGYRCERCGHQWIPRREELPNICPKCKTPYWDFPKKALKTKAEARAAVKPEEKRLKAKPDLSRAYQIAISNENSEDSLHGKT